MKSRLERINFERKVKEKFKKSKILVHHEPCNEAMEVLDIDPCGGLSDKGQTALVSGGTLWSRWQHLLDDGHDLADTLFASLVLFPPYQHIYKIVSIVQWMLPTTEVPPETNAVCPLSDRSPHGSTLENQLASL